MNYLAMRTYAFAMERYVSLVWPTSVFAYVLCGYAVATSRIIYALPMVLCMA
jgi:hypothetical protein